MSETQKLFESIKNRRRPKPVPWMHANGVVKVILFTPAAKGAGYVNGPNQPIEWDSKEGGFRVSQFGRSIGAHLYEDVCHGRYEPVDGSKPVAKPRCWSDWLKLEEYMDRDDDGVPRNHLAGDVDKYMHPECIARKKAAAERLARDGAEDISNVLGGGK